MRKTIIQVKQTFSTSEEKHWYALRLAYANEAKIRKVYDSIVSDKTVKVKGFFPTLIQYKKVGGKIEKAETCRFNNIFFIYGTFNQLSHFVYDNHNYKHLRFYSRHYNDGRNNVPIIVPDKQIRSLQIICNSNSNDVIVIEDIVKKFEKGQKVIIREGEFAGVAGIVSRFAGHQRVGIVIGSSFTITTAYIPSAFLECVE